MTTTSETFKRTQNLRLDNPVVVRKVPMNEHGCNMIRAIRDYQKDQLMSQEGLEVELQYPTSFHLMMLDYCKIKGIQVDGTQPIQN